MATRIAVFTDVHGNLPALAALLEHIKPMGCDALFHTGDAIAIGPYPTECLEMLLGAANCHCIMGNHDALFVTGLPQPRPEWMSDGEVQHQGWIHACLAPELRSVVAQWPYELQFDFEGIEATFVHYGLQPSKRDFVPIIPDPTASDLEQMFEEFRSDLVFYGHHHPFADVRGRGRFINPGSVGCHDQALARYCLVEFTHGTCTVEHHIVGYDDRPLYSAFEARQVPERAFLYRAFFGGRFPQ